MKRYISYLILAGLSAGAPNRGFDPAADFSLTKNPNGVWQYGYSETRSLDPGQFRIDTYQATVGKIGFWHPLPNKGPGPGYYPYVGFNTTGQAQYGSQNGWAARAGQVAMEASNSGQYSIVRFVAPAAGRYQVTARFEGVHFNLSSTDVHVLHDAESLFDADIAGYGGDPAFHKVEGAHPTASFAGVVPMKVGETIAFAVGYGKNQTHFSDTTGLSAEIKLLP